MAAVDPVAVAAKGSPKVKRGPEPPAAPAVQPVMRRWPHPVAVHPAPEGLAQQSFIISWVLLSQQTRQPGRDPVPAEKVEEQRRKVK